MVAFDMAGTTVRDNHEVEDCFAMAAEQCGIDMSESEIKSVQGWSKRFVFETYWKRLFPENSNDFTQKVDWSYNKFKEILEDYYLNHPVYPTEGCLETFEWLRKNDIRIALTTGFYRKVTNIILGKLGWLEGLNSNHIRISADAIIDITVASDEVIKGRPAPDMIFRCMSAFNLEVPKQVIAIGDTPSDIGAGQAADCLRTIALSNGTHTANQLNAFKPDVVLPNLSELPNYLMEANLIDCK